MRPPPLRRAAPTACLIGAILALPGCAVLPDSADTRDFLIEKARHRAAHCARQKEGCEFKVSPAHGGRWAVSVDPILHDADGQRIHVLHGETVYYFDRFGYFAYVEVD